jgi:hypothetical protein
LAVSSLKRQVVRYPRLFQQVIKPWEKPVSIHAKEISSCSPSGLFTPTGTASDQFSTLGPLPTHNDERPIFLALCMIRFQIHQNQTDKTVRLDCYWHWRWSDQPQVGSEPGSEWTTDLRGLVRHFHLEKQQPQEWVAVGSI